MPVRSRLEEEMKELEELLLKMGSLVENSIDLSMKALLEKNVVLAQNVIVQDEAIDHLENEIETKAIILLATQSPLASDLRRVSSILKIITDLERMGDHAVNIAEIAIEIGNTPFARPLVYIPKMYDVTKQMVKGSLDSFVAPSKQKAMETAKMDDRVDEMYATLSVELLSMICENKAIVQDVMQLLLVGRFLERIADHATNICERVIYMMTGERVSY